MAGRKELIFAWFGFMHRDNIIVGIDIGSSNIRTIIAQEFKGEENLRIVGVGIVPSFGVRRGVIVDATETAKVIDESVALAQRMAGIEVKNAIVSIGGNDICFQNAKGVIAVGRADGEVIEDDINRVINEVQSMPLSMNREIVHIIPRKYRLDDQDNIKDPLGMRGVRLEIDALVIESSASQIKGLTKCVYQAGVEIDDIVLAPLAAAKSALTKKQKELGVVLVVIGGGTTQLAVYEEGDLLHTAILPVGAGHITNDIAIGLRTSVDVAEKIKFEYGSSIAGDVDEKEVIDLSQIDSQEEGIVSRHHVAEIIQARLEEIFDLAQKELKSIGKAGLLPAGAVLVGGGAKLPQIVELAKEVLRLPIQIGFPQGFSGILDKVDDPSFATAAGLLQWGRERTQMVPDRGNGIKLFDTLSASTGPTVDKMKGWMKKFLP